MLHPTRRRLLLGVCAAAICSLAFAGPAQADFVVDDLDDTVSGVADTVCDAPAGDTCTLREAILEANNTVAPDTITFSVSGSHAIGSTLNVAQETVIDGNGSGAGAGNTIVDGNDAVRLFTTSTAGPVTFKDMRLEDGATVSDSGAAIALGGDGTLTNATVTSNVTTGSGSTFGGAISSLGSETLTLTDSTVSDNTVSTSVGGSINLGAGIYVEGPLTLTDSTVSGNMITAGDTRRGAGIYALAALDIDRSAITGNSGSVEGGGLFVDESTAGTRTISNSTFSGNSAGAGGGGGLLARRATTVESSTFASNSSTSGSAADILGESITGNVTVKNTILASSAAPPCGTVNGTIVSAVPGNNIDVGMSCGFGTTNGNQESTDPLLGGLALNAPGATQTHALMPTSPAIDTADAGCNGGLATDQRGVPRPQPSFGACDVGAFESVYRTLTVSTVGGGTVNGGGIDCPPDCSEMVPDGTMRTLTATAAAGSSFAGWTGCDVPAGNQCAQTLGADEAVTATFTADPVVIPPVVTPTPISPTATPTTTSSKKKCKKKRGGASAAKKCKKRK